jgi:hypothetical protein
MLLEVRQAALKDIQRGWLIFWQSADYLRTREVGSMLIGHGPYLVDGKDGSIRDVALHEN